MFDGIWVVLLMLVGFLICASYLIFELEESLSLLRKENAELRFKVMAMKSAERLKKPDTK